VDCLGCAIGRGEVVPPGGLIAATPHFVAHADPEIPIPAFLILAARRHVRSIAEMPAEEAQEWFRLVYAARTAMNTWSNGLTEARDRILDVTLIQEERSGHFHLWLFPWYAWMSERYPHSLTSIRVILQDAREQRRTPANAAAVSAAAAAIRAVFPDLKA